jgi:uncharacterized protein involved in exopolysaccharide biosynthesis
VEENVTTFAEYFGILRRRRKALLLTVLGVLLAGIYVTFSIKATYLSSAKFRVQQQSITEFLETPGSGNASEQIQLVRQRVLSTETLEDIVNRHSLYPLLTGGGPANYSAVERLREAIVLIPEYAEVFDPRSGRTSMVTIAFQMDFVYSQPQLTQTVAAEFADLILQENQNLRIEQAEETIDFLAADLASAEAEVDRTASVLADFREKHSGNLPELSGFNLGAMERVQGQIDNIDGEIRAARDRRQLLESELANPNLRATVYDENGEPIVGTAQQLADLQRQRLQLLSTYSPQHPDVLRIERQIDILAQDLSSSGAMASDIEQQLEIARTELSLARQQYSEAHPDVRSLVRRVETLEGQLTAALARPGIDINMASQDPVIQQLQTRIRAQETDIRTFQRRRAELVAELDELESKMLAMPQIEREFARLTRDNEGAIARFTEVRQKLDEARTAGKVEAEGGGARFILTDPPLLPGSPYKPNRLSLLLIVGFLAVVSGVGVALLRESTDGTVREAADLVAISGAPPIAVIPYIETRVDFRKRIALNLLTSAVVIGCIYLAYSITQSAV